MNYSFDLKNIIQTITLFLKFHSNNGMFIKKGNAIVAQLNFIILPNWSLMYCFAQLVIM